jgi:tRNA pseudouridine32 synthase/23S rRNA pseudouridine746 synthase
MKPIHHNNTDRFIHFKKPIDGIELPEKFTFPFYYEPHPLAILAAEQLKTYLETQKDWSYNFGIKNPDSEDAIGKMFGVMVVENEAKEIGFLAAFSGKMMEHEKIGQFVPAVFDSNPGGEFYDIGERELMVLTAEIDDLENSSEFTDLQAFVKKETAIFNEKLAAIKETTRAAKQVRKARRKEGKMNLSPADYAVLEAELARESVGRKYVLKDTERQLTEALEIAKKPLTILEEKLANLKANRKAKSVNLQRRLFQHYRFLNIKGERKDLTDIFQNTPTPSGAGECAAPKLLQYAFLHNLRPIAITEFWWGKSPASAVRFHKNHYPACTGKCKPILKHMLDGMAVDENPMLTNPALGKELPTVFEDDYIVIVNKPPEFLSVPGKNIFDSVQTRMQAKYPNATGNMTIHRLDMSTSGILILAKTKEAHKLLQGQFAKRKVKKRYVAVLDGVVAGDSGRIDLPLRVDLDNRPHQVICYEYGKRAVTDWEVIERMGNRTKVYFYPITGRTHQLRMHAAHPRGLGCPIVGDDLYGTKANRLHLHAQRLSFEHPETKEIMVIEVEAEF